jgi:hypothetical protein
MSDARCQIPVDWRYAPHRKSGIWDLASGIGF